MYVGESLPWAGDSSADASRSTGPHFFFHLDCWDYRTMKSPATDNPCIFLILLPRHPLKNHVYTSVHNCVHTIKKKLWGQIILQLNWWHNDRYSEEDLIFADVYFFIVARTDLRKQVTIHWLLKTPLCLSVRVSVCHSNLCLHVCLSMFLPVVNPVSASKLVVPLFYLFFPLSSYGGWYFFSQSIVTMSIFF